MQEQHRGQHPSLFLRQALRALVTLRRLTLFLKLCPRCAPLSASGGDLARPERVTSLECSRELAVIKVYCFPFPRFTPPLCSAARRGETLSFPRAKEDSARVLYTQPFARAGYPPASAPSYLFISPLLPAFREDTSTLTVLWRRPRYFPGLLSNIHQCARSIRLDRIQPSCT